MTILIIPILNEENFVEELIARLRKALSGTAYKILFIDDGSRDSTLQKITRASLLGDIDLIARKKTIKGCARGKALIDGLRYALEKYPDANVFVEMDSDGAHSPEEIELGINLIANGADVAIGSKYLTGSKIKNRGAFRSLVSLVNTQLLQWVLKSDITDYSNGFRVYNLRAAKVAASHSFKFQTPIYLGEVLALWIKNNLRVNEFPSTYSEREIGESKVLISDVVEGLAGVAHIFKTMRG